MVQTFQADKKHVFILHYSQLEWRSSGVYSRLKYLSSLSSSRNIGLPGEQDSHTG